MSSESRLYLNQTGIIKVGAGLPIKLAKLFTLWYINR